MEVIEDRIEYTSEPVFTKEAVLPSCTDMRECRHWKKNCHKCLIPELVREMESIRRQADDWCCANDSGNPASRFDDIAERLRALIEKAKLVEDCEG